MQCHFRGEQYLPAMAAVVFIVAMPQLQLIT
jgi:hypothetical protein